MSHVYSYRSDTLFVIAVATVMFLAAFSSGQAQVDRTLVDADKHRTVLVLIKILWGNSQGKELGYTRPSESRVDASTSLNRIGETIYGVERWVKDYESTSASDKLKLLYRALYGIEHGDIALQHALDNSQPMDWPPTGT